MGDGDDGAALGQLGDGVLDEMLVLGVNAGGCLVQNDNGRIFKDCPGNGNTLLFPAGKGTAALADYGVVAVRQCHNEIVAACLFRSIYHLLLRGIRLAEADVGADGIVEQIHILEHHGNVGKQAFAGHLSDIHTAHGNAAVIYIIEAGKQAADGGLAGAGRSHNGSGSLFGNGKAHILQNLSFVIAEVHMGKGNVMIGKRNVPAVLIHEVVLLQGIELVHGIVYDA